VVLVPTRKGRSARVQALVSFLVEAAGAAGRHGAG
jgi:hypothetical protein